MGIPIEAKEPYIQNKTYSAVDFQVKQLETHPFEGNATILDLCPMVLPAYAVDITIDGTTQHFIFGYYPDLEASGTTALQPPNDEPCLYICSRVDGWDKLFIRIKDESLYLSHPTLGDIRPL
jgi:hypothetical protein